MGLCYFAHTVNRATRLAMTTDLSLYRKEIQVAGTAPVRLSVIDIGPLQAPSKGTVVCLHGCGGHAEQWTNQINHLAKDHRVIAPDLRGHGKSEVPDSAYSLEEFLWDFTQLVHQLKVEEPFTLMAHSFGGPLGVTFTQGRLEAIDKLVLVASSPDMRLETWIEMILKSPISLSVLERLRPILLPKTFAPLFVIQRVTAGSLFRWRGWDLLPLIKKPTLIVGGQFDHIVRTKSLERMHKLIPNSRLEIIRYTRHLPHLERPAAVNRVIDGFLGQRKNWRDAPTEGMAG